MGIIDKDRFKQVLTDAGWTADEADLQVRLCDIDLSLGLTKDGTASVKAGFMSGAYTDSEAKGVLTKLGVSDDRITQLMFNWHLKLNARRRQVAAKEVSGWFIDGIIDITDFTSRLTKLDYNAQDVTRIIQAAILEQAKRIARAQKQTYTEMQRAIEKNLRESEKRRKESDRLQRQREKELRDQLAAAANAEQNRLEKFLSARTETNLRKWLAANEITELEVRETLRLKGWIDRDITRWLDIERNKR